LGAFTTHDNSVIRDWRLLSKGEDRAADLDGLEERSLVCHCDVVVVVAERGVFVCYRSKGWQIVEVL
jgi:hypothetical protein